MEVMLRYSLLFPDSIGNCIGDRGLDTGWSQVPYLAQGENVKLLLSDTHSSFLLLIFLINQVGSCIHVIFFPRFAHCSAINAYLPEEQQAERKRRHSENWWRSSFDFSSGLCPGLLSAGRIIDRPSISLGLVTPASLQKQSLQQTQDLQRYRSCVLFVFDMLTI